MANVSFKEVSKIYPDGTRAVTGVSLEVRDGELLVLVGPSGCGKSTLIRMLAGLEEVTSGEILIGERSVANLPPQQRGAAMVFQNYALYPHMTVRQNLAFPLKMQKMGKAAMEGRISEISRLLGLGDLLDRKPAQLSGGQRQRVAMGRALVREPEVFLMDEPLSNLDAKLRAQIRTDIASLQRRLGTTTLYVTHDQVEAMTLGHRIGVLDAGRLRQIGTPREIYDAPANLFVAAFFGSPGMNLVPARIRREENERYALTVAGKTMDIQAAPAAPSFDVDPEETYFAGFRPEALSVTGLPSSDREDQTPVVEAIELLGHEQIAYLRLPETADEAPLAPALRRLDLDPSRVAARLSAEASVDEGRPVALSLTSGHLHLFDPRGEHGRLGTLLLKSGTVLKS